MSLTLTIPRELKSPNKWNGRHWRYKHRETQQWEHDIGTMMLVQSGTTHLIGVLLVLGAFPWQRCMEKRRVTVTRLVPSARNFIKDDDNLRFATKPLNDALKRLGLIHDDSRKWLEQVLPTQEVSGDKQYATRIQIEPIKEPA